MAKKNQTIKCQVESCAFNAPDHYCQLKEIKVCACRPCDCDSVSIKEESMCDSFQEKDRSFF